MEGKQKKIPHLQQQSKELLTPPVLSLSKTPSDATREVETLFLVAAGCKHVLQKVPQETLTQNCICECPVGICTLEMDLN